MWTTTARNYKQLNYEYKKSFSLFVSIIDNALEITKKAKRDLTYSDERIGMSIKNFFHDVIVDTISLRSL